MQYVHDRWGAEEGFVGGEVNAIAQSGDGYLWIGTERGLVRFDGESFRLLQRPIPEQPAIGPVRQLVADGEGSVWVRVDGRRLLRYRDGMFEDVVRAFNLPLMVFTAMATDNGGGMLLSQLGNATYRYRNGNVTKVSGMDEIPGNVISIAETRDHTLWFGTIDHGLFRLEDGSLSPVGDSAERDVNVILPANNGGLWIGTSHGLDAWDGKVMLHDPADQSLRRLQILSLSKDAEGSVWLGTSQGLARITAAGEASLEMLAGEPGAQVSTTFIDREGALWFGGPRGIERLRGGTFSPYTTAWGLPTDSNGPIRADQLGRIWVAPLSGGLYWFKDRKVAPVKLAGPGRDVVYSIAEDAGRIWLGRRYGGLTVLEDHNGVVTEKTYDQSSGLSQESVFSLLVARDHSVWAGTVSGGINRFKDGRFTTWKTGDGLSSETVNSIAEDRDGTIWAATPNGLDAFRGGRWRAYGTGDGLPANDVRTLFDDEEAVLWIATSDGLAYFAQGSVHWPCRTIEALREPIAGMAEDAKGSLWLITTDHVVEVSRDKLLSDSASELDVRTYGMSDGLPGVEGVARDRSMVSDNAHRIWISLNHGLAMTEGKVTAQDAAPAVVRIESVLADSMPLPRGGPLTIEHEAKNITFVYGVAALSNLDRFRYRYKLDGFDKNWSDITSLRQVTFTNLNPRAYRFQVIAANAAGLWNSPVSTVDFAIKPAYWQTWWFRVLVPLACLLLLFGLYRLRMYRLVRGMNQRFQERLSERTRIAQELHDTLLQGVLSAAMQLDVAEDQLPEDSPVKPRLQRVMHLMSRVTEEGRNALRGLRTAGDANLSLEQSFARVKNEMALNDDTKFRVVSINAPRPVRPVIRDEVYRIGREALTNAFHHARARSIEIEIEYASSHLRVLVRDDGRGIDSAVMASGREGHFGLIGMRERSEKIGGRLKLRSRIDAGTEVELTIPGALAFGGPVLPARDRGPDGVTEQPRGKATKGKER
jgi:signal transduction histidine kinase/ligand-binding sensor domain-containing protein